MERYPDPDIKILLCDYRNDISVWRHKNVFNSWWYFYWNSKPGALIKIQNSEYRLKPEEFCLIAPETAFSTRIESPFNHFYLHFTAGTPFDRIKSKIYFFPVDEIVSGLIAMILKLLPERTFNSTRLTLMAHSAVGCLLLHIAEKELQGMKKYDPRIEAAVDLLNKNISTITPNEYLAENAGMSVNGFIRLFADELGITPQKYSRRRRIEEASVLLHFSDKTIDKIAQETGFLDRYHFSRAFKETTNYSPAEFRKHRISF